MNRETLIAIFLGFAGGILVALLLIIVPRKVAKTNDNVTPTPSPSQETNQQDSELTITAPENQTLIEDSKVVISGTTKPDTKLILLGPSTDLIFTADNNGAYSQEVDIYEGENLITITAYLQDGKLISKNLTVFSTQEKL